MRDHPYRRPPLSGPALAAQKQQQLEKEISTVDGLTNRRKAIVDKLDVDLLELDQFRSWNRRKAEEHQGELTRLREVRSELEKHWVHSHDFRRSGLYSLERGKVESERYLQVAATNRHQHWLTEVNKEIAHTRAIKQGILDDIAALTRQRDGQLQKLKKVKEDIRLAAAVAAERSSGHYSSGESSQVQVLYHMIQQLLRDERPASHRRRPSPPYWDWRETPSSPRQGDLWRPPGNLTYPHFNPCQSEANGQFRPSQLAQQIDG